MRFPPLIRFVLGLTTLLFGASFGLIALSFTLVQLVAPVPALMPPVFGALAVMLVASTTYLWFRAARTAEGDDVFSGERGILFSLMVVTVLLLGLGFLWAAMHLEFWQGMLEGMARAARDRS